MYVDMLYYRARTVPHRAAIIQSDMVTTYQGLVDGIESICERIDRLNLSKREPVAVCISNPSFLLATCFALMRCGYDMAPVRSQLYPHLAGAGIRNLIYEREGLVAAGGRNIRFDMSWLPSQRPGGAPRTYRARSTENVNMIFFTSGTTGAPKRVIQTTSALNERLKYVGYISEVYQKVLIRPGVTSTFGFNRTCEVLGLGKTACFAPNDLTALSMISKFSIECVVSSPSQAMTLTDTKEKNPDYRTESLKEFFIGGGRIEAVAIARVRAALCRNVIHMFGATEAGTIGRTPFEVLGDVGGIVVLPWVEIEIVDENDRKVSQGTEGIVRIRTPQLTESLKTAGPQGIPGVRNDWFYSGDLGRLSEDRVLYITGRTTNVLNRGGVKISGTRLEEVLRTMPGVTEAAACNVVGASGLEEIWVALITTAEIDFRDVKKVMLGHEAIRTVPDEIFIVDSIPRGETGKILRPQLKEQLIQLKRGSVTSSP